MDIPSRPGDPSRAERADIERAFRAWLVAGGFPEVDFLVRGPDGHRQLIQVCADASDPTTAARELRALAAASAQYPDAAMRLLTLTRDGLPDVLPADVVGQPAYAWMLDRTVGADAIV